jgi:hypothetical protein
LIHFAMGLGRTCPVTPSGREILSAASGADRRLIRTFDTLKVMVFSL